MPGPNSPYTQLSANQVLTQSFDESKDRLRVDAEITASIDADLQVEIDAATGDNIAIANADGSKKATITTLSGKNGLDVNILNFEPGNLTTTYSEINSLASGSLTIIGTYTALGDCRLKKIVVSGTNIATYSIYVDAVIIDKARTYFGNSLNTTFDLGIGVALSLGEVVTVRVIHNRPDLGDFNARIDIED